MKMDRYPHNLSFTNFQRQIRGQIRPQICLNPVWWVVCEGSRCDPERSEGEDPVLRRDPVLRIYQNLLENTRNNFISTQYVLNKIVPMFKSPPFIKTRNFWRF